MLSLNTVNPLQNLRIGTVMPGSESGGAQSSQSLKDVIDKLSQAVTKDGQLDKDSPLGKMVAKELPFGGMLGSSDPGAIKGAVEKLIHDKLGDNFGAAADLEGGGGAGKPDLMSQALNGLGKASLDDLLTKKANGSEFDEGDQALLEKIAQFMDQNPGKFPAPDSGSWKNELLKGDKTDGKEHDNFLDGKETDTFRSALDMLGSQLGQQQNGAEAAGGGLGTPQGLTADPVGGQGTTAAEGQSGNVTQDLGQLLSGLLEKGLEATLGGGGNAGANAGGGLGTPVNDAAQPASGNQVTQDLGKLLGGLLEKGLQASQNGGAQGAGQGNQLFAQHDLQSSAAQAASAIVAALQGGGGSSAVS